LVSGGIYFWRKNKNGLIIFSMELPDVNIKLTIVNDRIIELNRLLNIAGWSLETFPTVRGKNPIYAIKYLNEYSDYVAQRREVVKTYLLKDW
jgi:hypothetical protein